MQFPPELLNQIGVILEMLVAGITALTVAFWIALVIWTLRDIRSRTRDFFAWLLAGLLVLILGPIGLLLYLLLRPKHTLAEVYDRQLEEEALLRDITARRACPKCQTVTEPDWLICPICATELRRTCAIVRQAAGVELGCVSVLHGRSGPVEVCRQRSHRPACALPRAGIAELSQSAPHPPDTVSGTSLTHHRTAQGRTSTLRSVFGMTPASTAI